MDPITQAALGAVVGQACAGRRLGPGRAALWGAVAGAFPDVDSLIANVVSDDPLLRVQAHRGLTHSVFFAPVAGPLWGWALWRWARWRARAAANAPPYGPWLILMTCALLSHPLLDLCTHYGTQLLSPLTDRRFALPAIPIIDPRYTLTLAFGLVLTAFVPRRHAQRIGAVALLISTAYLLLGLKINFDAQAWARADLASKGILASEVYAFPTLFQLPHRRLLARTPQADYVGFVTLSEPCAVDWQPQVRYDGPAAAELRASEQGRIFEWFANGLTTAYREGDRVILADLRYGFTTDARQGNWVLESRISAAGGLTRPQYIRRPRPRPSSGNIAALWQEAYPGSCSAFTGTLVLEH